jgi:hypothetical protein
MWRGKKRTAPRIISPTVRPDPRMEPSDATNEIFAEILRFPSFLDRARRIKMTSYSISMALKIPTAKYA